MENFFLISCIFPPLFYFLFVITMYLLVGSNQETHKIYGAKQNHRGFFLKFHFWGEWLKLLKWLCSTWLLKDVRLFHHVIPPFTEFLSIFTFSKMIFGMFRSEILEKERQIPGEQFSLIKWGAVGTQFLCFHLGVFRCIIRSNNSKK